MCWNLAVIESLTGVFPIVATANVCVSLLRAITIVAAAVANNARTLNNITTVITRHLFILMMFDNFSSAILIVIKHKYEENLARCGDRYEDI